MSPTMTMGNQDRVARTIADLAGAPRVLAEHVAEAVQYRRGLRER